MKITVRELRDLILEEFELSRLSAPDPLAISKRLGLWVGPNRSGNLCDVWVAGEDIPTQSEALRMFKLETCTSPIWKARAYTDSKSGRHVVYYEIGSRDWDHSDFLTETD